VDGLPILSSLGPACAGVLALGPAQVGDRLRGPHRNSRPLEANRCFVVVQTKIARMQ